MSKFGNPIFDEVPGDAIISPDAGVSTGTEGLGIQNIQIYKNGELMGSPR